MKYSIHTRRRVTMLGAYGYGLVICLMGYFNPVCSQELNATVVVNAQNAAITEDRLIQDMQQDFEDFLNNNEWTGDSYAPKERINCNLIITLEEVNQSNYRASALIQSSRPVYGVGYETLVLNFADRDWSFQYVDGQPLQYNRNTYLNEVSALLSFYAHIILGMDYDTFSPLGGAPHFQQAQQIAQVAQQEGGSGWDAFGQRNRFQLIASLINPQIEPVRQANYAYHRLGLDTFLEDEAASRAVVLKALQDMQKIAKLFPQSLAIIAFFDAKNEEIVSIFSKGDLPVRRDAYNALVEINPSETDEYNAILQN